MKIGVKATSVSLGDYLIMLTKLDINIHDNKDQINLLIMEFLNSY